MLTRSKVLPIIVLYACLACLVGAGSVAAQAPELVVQTGHADVVQAVLFTRDGRTLMSGSWDNTIKLWDVQTGTELRTLAGHTDRVWSLALNPDESILASASTDDTIKLWDMRNGRELRTLTGHALAAGCVAFSPDGKTLVSGGADNLIKYWDVQTGKELRTLTGHTDYLNALTFQPGGDIFATGDHSGAIKLWDFKTGTVLRTIKSEEGANDALTFSPDGKTLAGGMSGGQIKLWSVADGHELRSIKGHEQAVEAIAFSPDGRMLFSASWDQTIKFWDAQTGVEVRSIHAHEENIQCMTLSRDGRLLASGDWGRKIKLWDAGGGAEVRSLEGHAAVVNSVALSADRRLLAVGSDNVIKVWNLSGESEPHALIPSVTTMTLAMSADGRYLAAGEALGGIELWDLKAGGTPRKLESHSGITETLAFTADGQILASGSWDKSVKLWDVATGKLLRTLEGHKIKVMSVAFTADAKTLASGSNDGVVILWDTASGTARRTLTAEGFDLQVLAISRDGSRVAAGDANAKSIKIWDATTGKELRTLNGHAEGIMHLAFSPDDRILASSSFDGTVKLWAPDSGNLLGTLTGHTNWVGSVGFSGDGKMLVSGSTDAKVKVWDVQSRRELASLISLGEKDWVVATPDGRFDGSDGAQKLMHYIYGLEVITLGQLKEMYFEPGLLAKLTGFSKDPLRPILPLKDVKLHPEVVEQRIEPNSSKLTIKLRNRGGGIGEVRVLVNDKLAVADARTEALRADPFVPEATLTVDLKDSAHFRGRLCDEKGENCKENKVTVITSNYLKEIGKGNINSRGYDIGWELGGQEEFNLPTLYAIVGGVSDYDGEQIDLKFAAKDAEDFAAALRLGGQRLFCASDKPQCLDKVKVEVLSTSGKEGTALPTKENFRKAFERVAREAGPEDILVVYLAGHGVSLGTNTDTYFYLTQQARSAGREDLAKVYRTTAISSEELTEWLTLEEWVPGQKGVKALKQVLILDTCASGTAAAQLALTAKRDLTSDQVRAIEFLKDKTGTHILMASTADAPSYEASQFGQGLLTYALLEGMSGQALQNVEYVDVQTLFRYAEGRVPQLAQNVGGVQRPINSSPLGKTFVIGQMTSAELQRMRLPTPKPMVLRPRFSSGEEGDDPMNLIGELRKRLDAESSYEVVRRNGGGEPVLVYVDDDSFPGGVRPTGTYTIEGDRVRVKAFLRRDGKTVAALPEVVAARDKVVAELLSAIRAALSKLPAV